MKFYYLREFKNENGFSNLSILERLILSAALTKKINEDDRDYVEIIMNFDGQRDYTPYLEWQNYKDFVKEITNFLHNEKGYIFDYVLKNYKERNTIHYIAIDYNSLYITGKNSISNISCRAFILGAANHSVNDNNDWFQFNLCQWSKTTMSHKKRSLQEIDNFMNSNNINYAVQGNKIIILNKHKQKDKNEIFDIENKKEEKSIEVKPIEVKPIEVKPVQKEEKNEYDKILEEENIFNLVESHLSRKMIADFNEEHRETYNETIPEIYKKKYLKYINAFNILDKDRDVNVVVDGGYIHGEDGFKRKQEAICKILKFQNNIIASLDKLYSEDKNCYIEIMKRIRTIKVLTFDTELRQGSSI